MNNTQEAFLKNAETFPNAVDDEEIIAVLTAAVAALLNTSTYNLNIKSYRKMMNQSPVWNAVSRRENIENKL